jgi:hypothetical protein
MDSSERRLKRTLAFLRVAAGLLAALVLTLAGAFSYAMFFRQTKLEPEYQARVIAEVERRLAANSDELAEEAQDLASETLPPLGQALYVQAREDYPRYLSTFRGEGGIFITEVEDLFLEEAKGKYARFLARHQQVLAEEFPEQATEERVRRLIGEFQARLDKLVERYYVDEFRPEAERTIALWHRVQPLPPPAAHELPLEEELTELVADWTILAFTEEVE